MTAPRMIRAANPSLMTLDGTRTYIVGRRQVVVIDPGPNDPEHIEAVAAELVDARSIDIVLTHHHADHAGAARALAARTGGQIRAGASHDSAASTGLDRLTDGQVLETDLGPLSVLTTPGHTPDHIALVWGPEDGERAVFVGDLLLGEGDTTLVAAPEGDVGDYLRSLDRLEAVAAGRLYPTHGDPLTSPAAAIRRFRDHRRERVDQVRQILALAPRSTTSDIVDRLYGEALPSGLREAASASIEAVRSYLASIGGLRR